MTNDTSRHTLRRIAPLIVMTLITLEQIVEFIGELPDFLLPNGADTQNQAPRHR